MTAILQSEQALFAGELIAAAGMIISWVVMLVWAGYIMQKVITFLGGRKELICWIRHVYTT